MEINATQIRKGMIVFYNNRLYRVEEMEHITPGRYKAVVQTRMRALDDLKMYNFRFHSDDTIEKVSLETREVSFSYEDGDTYVFMDNENYEQIVLTRDFVGDNHYYLKENETYKIEFFKEKPVNLIPPLTMEFKVVQAEKSLKGATVQAMYKPAVLENGMTVQVPPFIEEGNVLKIDTRDGSYIERVNK